MPLIQCWINKRAIGLMVSLKWVTIYTTKQKNDEKNYQYFSYGLAFIKYVKIKKHFWSTWNNPLRFCRVLCFSDLCSVFSVVCCLSLCLIFAMSLPVIFDLWFACLFGIFHLTSTKFKQTLHEHNSLSNNISYVQCIDV